MLPLKQAFFRVAMLTIFINVAPLAAETSSPQPQGGAAPIAAPAPQKAPDVFDLQSKPGPVTTKSSVSGTERFVGDEPDYNTEQRAKWLAICEPLKEKNFDKYRECYQNEKKKSAAAIRDSFERRERRTNQMYRNVGPDQNTDDSRRNPAFDVQVESTKE